MTDESKMVMRAAKCANIIMALGELYGLPIQEATDVFYSSETADLIEEGVQTCNVAVTNILPHWYGRKPKKNDESSCGI